MRLGKKVALAWLSLAIFSYAVEADFTEKFEKKSVYGKWIDIDKGKVIEINSRSSFSFERLDDDLIILRDGQKKNYLKRIGTMATKITGRIVEDRGTQNFYAIGGQTVTLTNTKDSAISMSTTTNARGFFTDTSLPTGDYILSAQKGRTSISIPVSLKDNHEALGTFILQNKKSANFKSELLLEEDSIISNGKRYKGMVLIRNYGVSSGKVCYNASMKDKDLRTLNFAASCKTIAANKSIEVPIYFSFKPISINSVEKELTVTLKDSLGRNIEEHHPFEVYKSFFNLTLKTPLKSITGYVIVPGHGVKTINTQKGYISLPKLSDEDYGLILANSDPKTKTAYEVDIGAEQKLTRGMPDANQRKSNGRSKKGNNLFKLKQSIGRYPDIGDIAIYAFNIPDVISMREDDAPLRVPFTQRDSMGDKVNYEVSIFNDALARVSYDKGILTVIPHKDAYGITTILLKNGAGYGKQKYKPFTLVIRSINDKPVITSTPHTKIVEGNLYSYYFKGKDIESKHLTKKLIKAPKWLKYNKQKSLLTGRPMSNDAGDHTVIMELSDGDDSVRQTFTITVTALARAPKSTDIAFIVNEDTKLEGKVSAKAAQGVITYSLASKPLKGSVTFKADGTFSYMPQPNYYGDDSFEFKATSQGKSSTSKVMITVKSINDLPTARNIEIQAVGKGPVKVDWLKASLAMDVDEDELKIKIIKPTKLGTLKLNEEEELVYTPEPETKGNDKATLRIEDGSGGSVDIVLSLYGVDKQLTPKVLQTGQKVIYYRLDDAIYKKSLPRSYALDLDKSIVKDMTMDLSWYAEPEPQKRTFEEAKEYCEELDIYGFDKWRLPTIEELVLLSDKGKTRPAIDYIFTNIKSNFYWSSTEYVDRRGHVWMLYFDDGSDLYREKNSKHYTLCTRDGTDFKVKRIVKSDGKTELVRVVEGITKTAESHTVFDDNATENVPADLNATADANATESNVTKKEVSAEDGLKNLFEAMENKEAEVAAKRDATNQVIVDPKTELMWYDGPDFELSTWIGAIRTCEELKYAGYDDWRLPNFNELYTITDHSGIRPAVKTGFVNVSTEGYWSSTSSDNDHDRAWGISFYRGSDFTYDKTEQIHTRCVRDQ